jgi:hypothetical protein
MIIKETTKRKKRGLLEPSHHALAIVNVKAHGPPGWLQIVALPIPYWPKMAAFPRRRRSHAAGVRTFLGL